MPAREIVALLVLVPGILSPCAGWAYEPQMNYTLQCMGCHTPDGSGVPDRVPSMRETLVPLAAKPDGRRYLVQVPGAAQSTLSDAELAQLLNWMIDSLSATRGTFVPFTASEVSQYRRHALLDVRGTRERVLRGLAQ
ncbi:MAG TPA: cytochrome c [Steroidobacteraceae bacterium]|nr:cytochrome c [Steroidobacteraceae bacterium]